MDQGQHHSPYQQANPMDPHHHPLQSLAEKRPMDLHHHPYVQPKVCRVHQDRHLLHVLLEHPLMGRDHHHYLLQVPATMNLTFVVVLKCKDHRSFRVQAVLHQNLLPMGLLRHVNRYIIAKTIVQLDYYRVSTL